MAYAQRARRSHRWHTQLRALWSALALVAHAHCAPIDGTRTAITMDGVLGARIYATFLMRKVLTESSNKHQTLRIPLKIAKISVVSIFT